MMSDINSSPLRKIGQALKEARKNKGLSISELAGILKIGNEQLVALEAGDEEKLPEKVFVKAMINRVAEKLKLDINSEDEKLKLDINSEDEKLKLDIDSEDTPPTPDKLEAEIPIKDINKEKILNKKFYSRLIYSLSILFISFISWKSFNILPDNKEKDSNTSLIKNSIANNRLRNEFVEIISLKPSQITITNQKDQIIFQGIVSKPLKYSTRDINMIYALRPDLIQLKSSSGQKNSLGEINNLRWYKVINKISQ